MEVIALIPIIALIIWSIEKKSTPDAKIIAWGCFAMMSLPLGLTVLLVMITRELIQIRRTQP
jgi:hypothetical protein